MKRNTLIAVSLGCGLLTGCAGVTLAEIAMKVSEGAKATCGVIVQVQDIIKNLTGFDPKGIGVVAFVDSICSQFTALSAATAATVPPPPSTAVQAGTANLKCYYVQLNNQPLTACKPQ